MVRLTDIFSCRCGLVNLDTQVKLIVCLFVCFNPFLPLKRIGGGSGGSGLTKIDFNDIIIMQIKLNSTIPIVIVAENPR